MKKITSKDLHGNEWDFLCLETVDDLSAYQIINEQIKSKQAVGFWFGFKSQTFRQSIMDYALHEVDRNNGMAHVLAMKLNSSQKKTSIVEYCTIADELISDMHASMLKYIDKEQFVRINKTGGYCPLKDIEEYYNIEEIDVQEMCNYLLSGDFKSKFEIASDTIVIENSDYVPERLIKEFCKLSSIEQNKIQVLSNFYTQSILFKKEDFIMFFMRGMRDHNLTNIVFETTGQDVNQINDMKAVFEYLIGKQAPSRILNIYVKIHPKDIPLFKTEVKNINVIFMPY